MEIPRRTWLQRTGVLGLGALGLGSLARPGLASGLLDPDRARESVLHKVVVLKSRRGTCTPTPSMTQGPFYLNTGLVRQNISENRPGLPLRLYFRVVSVATCNPIPGAAVDVWHCDAPGVYSGFVQPGGNTVGQTFLRGIQFTQADGVCFFETIYPGWYPGRTTHIHVKVRPTPTTELTTQVYFGGLWDIPSITNVTQIVNQYIPPYNLHGPNPTTNQNDPIFNPATVLTMILNPNGSLSLWAGIIIAVN